MQAQKEHLDNEIKRLENEKVKERDEAVAVEKVQTTEYRNDFRPICWRRRELLWRGYRPSLKMRRVSWRY